MSCNSCGQPGDHYLWEDCILALKTANAPGREELARALHGVCIAYMARHERRVMKPYDDRPWTDIPEPHREHHRQEAADVLAALQEGRT